MKCPSCPKAGEYNMGCIHCLARHILTLAKPQRAFVIEGTTKFEVEDLKQEVIKQHRSNT